MSRNIPAALQEYMEGYGLHMCKLIKIGPLPDGTYRTLAELDRNFDYNDGEGQGEQTYIARTGMQVSAFATSADLAVDNAEFDTLPPVSGFALEGITDDQIRSGALDDVPYVVYCLSYKFPEKGHFIWAGGTIGEVRIKNSALINVEQRSISNKFKQIIGDVDSTTCRAKFGSQATQNSNGTAIVERFPCEYDAESEWVDFTVTDVDSDDPDLIFMDAGLAQSADYFNPGDVRFDTGANAGIIREVGDFGAGIITLKYGLPYSVAIGDTGQIRRQCTKHWTGHNSCQTFWGTEKTLHFRGEPHIPVGDATLANIPGAGIPGGLDGTGEDVGPLVPVAPTTGGGGSTSGSPTERTYGATTVNVFSYGAAGDGVTDDTAAFAAAYAALPVGGGTVTTNAGVTHLIDPDVSIKPLSNTRLLIPDTTILKASYTATDHRYVIHIDTRTEVQIEGGQIIGYRDSWSPISGTTSEWGHGIFVDGGSAITIKDMTISKCVGDGISIGVLADDVWVDNVLSTNNRRQAFTVGRSTNVTLSNCEGSYTGGTNGTAPKAGLDIEPDNPDTQNSSNTTITDCNFHHNDGPGIIAYRSADSVTIEGTRMAYNTYGLHTTESSVGSLKGCTIEHNRFHGARFTGGTAGWVVGGSGADKNTFFNNNTSLNGEVLTGDTITLTGESSQTEDHIRVDSSTVTVSTNDYRPA